MESGALSVGEEGKDFVTLPVVSNPHNPGIWDIYLSNRDYYHPFDRHPVVLCVSGRGIFTNQIEFYVRSVSYFEPKQGSMLLIGQIRDLVEGGFYGAEVFYSAQDVALERTGRVRVYLSKEEGNTLDTPEEIQPLFEPVTTISIG